MVRNGRINESLLDESVLRVLTEKFRLGLFEHPFPVADEEIGEIFNCSGSKEVSLQYS